MQSKETKKWQEEEALRRYRLIAPLLDESIDEAVRRTRRDEIAKQNNISIRTLYRYEAGYRNDQFSGLKPMNREKRRNQKLPDNYGEIVEQAIQLKKEVPRRSVRQIIRILEIEGYAPPGVIKQSTLQRHLFEAGFGRKQMKKYTEARNTSSRRFCRPHRMDLIQGDIKYGPDIRTKDGKLIKTYLSSLIDDHSRYIIHSEFYDNQSIEIVEDTYHKAILKYGVFSQTYLDNGTQYTSDLLHRACARLGIKVLHAKPRAAESKGKIERYHQTVDRFINELRIDHVNSLEELNQKWKYFLEVDYQKKEHNGIAEYYRAMGVDVPEGGITPEQEWNRDEKALKFLDVGTVAEAFLHHETRMIDKAGCFSFEGKTYEASTALIGAEVEIIYDPLDTRSIKVKYRDMAPIEAKPVEIGAYASRKPPVPVSMTGKIPETSRFLDAMEKEYRKNHQLMANALSFSDYGKAGDGNV